MTTTNAAGRRDHDQIERELERAVRLGLLAEYGRTNPTGNKLVWVLSVNDSPYEYETREVSAFLDGLRIALTHGRSPRMTPTREAILKEGRVVVDIKKDTKVMLKRQRNALFGDAYAVGFKGQFHVTREGDKLIGETDAYRAAHADADGDDNGEEAKAS